MKKSKRKPAMEITEYITRMYDKGLTTMSGGNLSIRGVDNSIWVTPGSKDKANLIPEDIMHVYTDGRIEGNTKVTSEFVVHKAVLESRKDCNAVLHAHSPIIIGFSAARIKPNTRLLASAYKSIGDRMTISPYQRAGSPELAKETVKGLSGDNKFTILENHGLFITDKDMSGCYEKLEIVEKLGKVELQSRIITDNNVQLSDSDIEKLNSYSSPELHTYKPVEWSHSEIEIGFKICELMKRMYNRDIITSSTGAMSVKLDEETIIITPRHFDADNLQVEDLVLIKNNMAEESKVPSEEIFMHMEIYRENPELKTIITGVPTYLMSYAVTDKTFFSESLWEAYWLLRKVPTIPFGIGEEFNRQVAKAIGRNTPTLLIQNCSYIVTSNDIMDAYDKIEVAESTAKGIIMTNIIAKPAEVEQEVIDYYDSYISKYLYGEND